MTPTEMFIGATRSAVRALPVYNAGLSADSVRAQYGLAGVRIGYGVASDARLVELMSRIRTPFGINHLAQCAALAALADGAHVEASVALAHERRAAAAKEAH